MGMKSGWPLLAVLGLAACGGNGDELPLASQQPGAAAQLTGVVAVGQPLAGATVTLRCAGGLEQFARTDDGGRYALPLARQILPCVLRAEGDAGGEAQVLHSLLVAGSLRVNITPLTELLLGRVADEAPAAFFAAWPGEGRSARLSAGSVAGALPFVQDYLGGLGVDIAALTAQPLLDGEFVAAPGDAHDAVLEALQARLAYNGLSLADAVAAVRAGVLPPPCSAATGFCWPYNSDEGAAGYKLLTENRSNDKNEPEAKFHETDVDVRITAIGDLAPVITSAADKSKSRNALPARTLHIAAGYQPAAGNDCGHAVPAGEACYTAFDGALTQLCAAGDEDDVLLALATVVAKDSDYEVKKSYDAKKPNNPVADNLKGLRFDRVIACTVQAAPYVVDADGRVDDAGVDRGLIADNIGRSADKLTERKFWAVPVAGRTRYVGVQAGSVDGRRQMLVLVSQ